MPIDRNKNSVLRQLAALQIMPMSDLQDRWRDLYGTEPPLFRKSFLLKRLTYRIQELFYGGLGDDARGKLSEAAANDPLANIVRRKKTAKDGIADSGVILPGTRLLREWNGREYEVIAKEKGFEYNGRNFRSLSAIATEITGTKWNGVVFFGLKRR